jgi:hypothetical protein
MATLVTNRSTGMFQLPPVYGSKVLAPGQAVIIADTASNVASVLGNPLSTYVDLQTVVDGQSGAITPNAEGSGGAEAYTPGTAGDWSATVPASIGAALDKLAASGAGGAGSHLGGDLSGNLPAATVGAGKITKAKTAMFISTEQTGTGAPQNIAHGLGTTPTAVFAAPTDTSPVTVGVYTVTEGAHDGTNIVLTVTSGKKFKVMAWA